MIPPSEKAEQAVAKFQFINSIDLFAGQGNSTKMKLFMPQINGREFDVLSIQESLMEVLIGFSLSRITVEKYEKDSRWARLSKEARKNLEIIPQIKANLANYFYTLFLRGNSEPHRFCQKCR